MGNQTKSFKTMLRNLKFGLDTMDKIWRHILTEDDTVSYAANENIK